MGRQKPDYAYELLARTLAGVRPTSADIDTLLHERVREGIHLDFKSGREVKDEGKPDAAGEPKTFRGKVRKFVAGFANGDGGLLVLGVKEPTVLDPDGVERRNPSPGARHTVDGVDKAGGMTADQVVLNIKEAVISLRPYLSRSPRICQVEHADGLVVVVAVERSDSLVICLEANQSITHYLRIGDSTTKAPGYLVEDLVLGRRQRTACEIGQVLVTQRSDDSVEVRWQVFNRGLVYMDEPACVLVGYGGQRPPTTVDLGRDVLSTIEVRPIEPTLQNRLFLTIKQPYRMPTGIVSAVAPLQSAHFQTELSLPIGERIWAGALAVVSRGQPPAWFELIYCPWRPPRCVVLPLGTRRPFVACADHSAFDEVDVAATEIKWKERDLWG